MALKRKQIKKLSDKCCFFCKEDNYAVLDAHRLQEGGVYEFSNILTICATCHRRVHSGEITVDPRKYLTTAGIYAIHYWRDGKEFWEFENKPNVY